ncbi:trichohyalin-like [Ischnura elegans]|uniref:trichohyalin-like n=1 Tax=Ischnura elegans TaxID=197161 RepID=UPI001ED8756D|nr:trichohyalin-like [Ischnura elegans]
MSDPCCEYQLQQEICAKEQALEDLKRKNSQIQNEMKLLCWENKQLQEKLGEKNKQPNKSSCKKEQNKKMEENMINHLQMQMKNMQRELQCMQMARKQAEQERCSLQDNASSMRNRPTTCPPQGNQDRNCEKIQQLNEKYGKLTEDFKAKVTEVAAMHVENENLISELDQKKKCLKEAETAIKELQDKLKAAEEPNERGSKAQTSQVMFLEQQLRDAKDELEELHMKQQECEYQEEYYREKYLLAQQQVEEQRRQIEMMEADNRRITKQVEEEIQRVKCQFQEKLEELKSLPEVLRTTQCRLQAAIQKQKQAEERAYELKMEAEDARARASEATQKLDQYLYQQQDSVSQSDSLASKAEVLEKKCKELTECNCKLKQELKRLEESAAQCKRCAEEKSVEILQLSNQLECVREDSARQVSKAKERCETIRRSYQCQIEDLERQLAQTRASARSAQAERDETRKRMQCEIGNLSENFEQAQSRIRYLQSHVNYLKKSFSNMLDQSNDDMNQCPPVDSGDFCNYD